MEVNYKGVLCKLETYRVNGMYIMPKEDKNNEYVF